jgi:phosphoribosylaminoimidazole carboxylase PurE protein
MVNEVAPRPHNSGHYTIEAVPYMSQYQAQLHAVLDLPIPEKLTPRVSSSIMINILGGASKNSHHKLARIARSTFSDDMDVYLHLYGKEPKPGRKIGHITLTGFSSIEDLEKFAAPFMEMVDEMRQERIEAAAQQLRPQEDPSIQASLDEDLSEGQGPVLKEVEPGESASGIQQTPGLEVTSRDVFPAEEQNSVPHPTAVKKPKLEEMRRLTGSQKPVLSCKPTGSSRPIPSPRQANAVKRVGPEAKQNGEVAPRQPLVLITMGSDSDLPVLKAGLDVLREFNVPYALDITSAHRTPKYMMKVADEAAGKGIKVIIAAAGGAAHLPGMLSSETPLPVIGVPVKATHLDGLDSLLSIVQMPVSLPSLALCLMVYFNGD